MPWFRQRARPNPSARRPHDDEEGDSASRDLESNASRGAARAGDEPAAAAAAPAAQLSTAPAPRPLTPPPPSPPALTVAAATPAPQPPVTVDGAAVGPAPTASAFAVAAGAPHHGPTNPPLATALPYGPDSHVIATALPPPPPPPPPPPRGLLTLDLPQQLRASASCAMMLGYFLVFATFHMSVVTLFTSMAAVSFADPACKGGDACADDLQCMLGPAASGAGGGGGTGLCKLGQALAGVSLAVSIFLAFAQATVLGGRCNCRAGVTMFAFLLSLSWLAGGIAFAVGRAAADAAAMPFGHERHVVVALAFASFALYLALGGLNLQIRRWVRREKQLAMERYLEAHPEEKLVIFTFAPGVQGGARGGGHGGCWGDGGDGGGCDGGGDG